MSDYAPHDMEWTPDRVGRFWDWYAGTGGDYQSQLIGAALLDLSESRISLSGDVLDFGCGLGFLLELLVSRARRCVGIDFSEKTVQAARRRLSAAGSSVDVVQVQGLPTSLAGGQFDVVFLVDAFEHLLPNQRDETLAEIIRLMKPGGFLVLSTPNAENLKASCVECPECGARYHRMQHVSSWNRQTLSDALHASGLFPHELIETNLSLIQWRKNASLLRRLYTDIFRRQRDLPQSPHLIAIGQKP